MSVLGELSVLSPATVASEGNEPEQIAVSPDGKMLLVCCRGSNKWTSFLINAGTGLLSKVETITFGEETYGVAFGLDSKNVFIACQKSSKVARYACNTETGKLVKEEEITVAVGLHALTVHPNGKYLYLPTYEGKAIYQMEIEASGKLKKLIPEKIAVTYQAHNIVFTKNGEWAYASTGESEAKVGILVCAPLTGLLTAKEVKTVGSGPGFTEIVKLSPDDKQVYAIQEGTTSGSVAVFTREPTLGTLTLLEKKELGKAPKDILPTNDGNNAYITLQGATEAEKSILQFSRSSETGALTAMSPTGIAPGEGSKGPSFLTITPNEAFVFAAMKESATGKVAQLGRFIPSSGAGMLGMLV